MEEEKHKGHLHQRHGDGQSVQLLTRSARTKKKCSFAGIDAVNLEINAVVPAIQQQSQGKCAVQHAQPERSRVKYISLTQRQKIKPYLRGPKPGPRRLQDENQIGKAGAGFGRARSRGGSCGHRFSSRFSVLSFLSEDQSHLFLFSFLLLISYFVLLYCGSNDSRRYARWQFAWDQPQRQPAFSQLHNRLIEGPCGSVIFVTPNLVENAVTRKHLAGVSGKNLEEPRLPSRNGNRLADSPELQGLEIKGAIAKIQAALRRKRRCAVSAQ